MPRKSMPWFRFYVETPTDRKVRRLKPEHRWLWVCVLCVAGSSPVPGALLVTTDEPISVDDLADLSGLSIASTRKGLAHLRKMRMIEKCSENEWEIIAKWKNRQYASDTSTDRVRAYRTRANGVRSNDDETFQPRSNGRFRNAPETETDTDNYSSSVVTTKGAPSTAVDDDPSAEVIHRHLVEWAKANGKRNPNGYAVTVATEHARDFDGIAGPTLETALEERWPITAQPISDTRPVGVADLGDGVRFMPGTGLVTEGPPPDDPTATLSDEARAALALLDADAS